MTSNTSKLLLFFITLLSSCFTFPVKATGQLSNQLNYRDDINLIKAETIHVSPDGTSVYVAARTSNSLVSYDRNIHTGQLSNQRIHTDHVHFAGATGIAISPDNTNVYVVSYNSKSISYFNRNTTTGTLSGLTVLSAPSLSGIENVIISPNGHHVYAVSFSQHSVLFWQRNIVTGELNNQISYQHRLDLDGAIDIVMAPDGKDVYVAAYTAGALVCFRRNVVTGVLDDFRRIFIHVPLTDYLKKIRHVIVSPNNIHVYAVVYDKNSIVRWLRDPASGKLSDPQIIVDSMRLEHPTSLAISPDGLNIYATAIISKSIVTWDVNSITGALTNEKVITDRVNLKSPYAVEVSPDGTNVYATCIGSNTMVAWDRKGPKNCRSTNGLVSNVDNVNHICTCGHAVCTKYTGMFCVNTTSMCTKGCRPGTYKSVGVEDKEKNDICLDCTIGKYSDIYGAYDDNCKLCSIGRFSTRTGLISNEECTLCDVGKKAGFNGSTSCTVCERNTYQNEKGQSQCKLCPGTSKISDNGIDAMLHSKVTNCIESKVATTTTTTVAPTGDNSGKSGSGSGSSTANADGGGQGNTSPAGNDSAASNFDGALFAGISCLVTLLVVLLFGVWRKKCRSNVTRSSRSRRTKNGDTKFGDTIKLQYSDNDVDVDDFEMPAIEAVDIDVEDNVYHD